MLTGGRTAHPSAAFAPLEPSYRNYTCVTFRPVSRLFRGQADWHSDLLPSADAWTTIRHPQQRRVDLVPDSGELMPVPSFSIEHGVRGVWTMHACRAEPTHIRAAIRRTRRRASAEPQHYLSIARRAPDAATTSPPLCMLARVRVTRSPVSLPLAYRHIFLKYAAARNAPPLLRAYC